MYNLLHAYSLQISKFKKIKTSSKIHIHFKMGIRNVAVALTLAVQLSAVIAVDPPGATIVGCSAVECPTGPGSSTSANCIVAGRKSSLIGLANFNTSIAGGNNLTWTETIEYESRNSALQFSFERSFYLGTPQGFNLTANATSSNIGACAVFFTNISAEAKFPGDRIQTSFGTCDDAVTTDCANALIKQAQLAVGPAGNSSSCESLKAEITKNLPPSCSKIATGDGAWQGIEVKGIPCADPFCSSRPVVAWLTQTDRSHWSKCAKPPHSSRKLDFDMLPHAPKD